MAEWIGVDLDGTLARYEGWGDGSIGEPIPAMLGRIRVWLIQDKTVKIFTARACDPEEKRKVEEWLKGHDLGQCEVTNVKDFAMIELWDDRAIRVIPNTGNPCCGK
jgi:hypothetical protein